MKKNLLSLPFVSLFAFCMTSLSCAAEFSWSDYYTIEDISIPKDIDPQVGGLAIDKGGRLVACFHRGEVAIYHEDTKNWKVFATGLHEPLGIYVEESGTILVIQRAELTRLHDKDGDGVADFYELVSNDWGFSGNYHEFTFGLVKDSKKNIYISLGTASNGAGVKEEIKGTWNNAGGLTHEDFLSGGKYGDWKEKKKKVARMYARVPYRGCVLQIKPGSSKANVYATGVRTPNGLYMDKNDQLWVSDNQGDWVGASKIHRIEEGGFHGHPASLLWAKNPPTVTPADLPVEQLDKMRIKAPALLPQGDCANSITQMLGFTDKFAPITKVEDKAEQLLVGEMNHSRLVRYMPDLVNGTHQGTSSHFFNTSSLDHGNNRIAYSADGKSLYVGKTHLSWPGREGLKKITYSGKPYLLVEHVELTPKGFKFTFNTTIKATEDLDTYVANSYGIAYHSAYGSKQLNLQEEKFSKVEIDGNTLTLELKEKPKSNRVYDITIPSTISSELSDLSYNRFWYTAHAVYE